MPFFERVFATPTSWSSWSSSQLLIDCCSFRLILQEFFPQVLSSLASLFFIPHVSCSSFRFGSSLFYSLFRVSKESLFRRFLPFILLCCCCDQREKMFFFKSEHLFLFSKRSPAGFPAENDASKTQERTLSCCVLVYIQLHFFRSSVKSFRWNWRGFPCSSDVYLSSNRVTNESRISDTKIDRQLRWTIEDMKETSAFSTTKKDRLSQDSWMEMSLEHGNTTREHLLLSSISLSFSSCRSLSLRISFISVAYVYGFCYLCPFISIVCKMSMESTFLISTQRTTAERMTHTRNLHFCNKIYFIISLLCNDVVL